MVRLANSGRSAVLGASSRSTPKPVNRPWTFSHYEGLAILTSNKIRVEKSDFPDLPEYYTESPISSHLVRENAIQSYRDSRPRQSIHAIEFPTYWELHVDDINPHHDPVGHLRDDAPLLYALGALGITHLVTNDFESSESDSEPIFET